MPVFHYLTLSESIIGSFIITRKIIKIESQKMLSSWSRAYRSLPSSSVKTTMHVLYHCQNMINCLFWQRNLISLMSCQTSPTPVLSLMLQPEFVMEWSAHDCANPWEGGSHRLTPSPTHSHDVTQLHPSPLLEKREHGQHDKLSIR